MENPPPPPIGDPADFFDWDNLFNFPLNPDYITSDVTDDHLLLPWPPSSSAVAADLPPPPESVSAVQTPAEGSTRVRKRDPRLICPNFIAGRVPCACPELDAQAAAAEEAAEIAAGGRKRRKSGGSQIQIKCQVPGCEVDIRELKGYHRRHRVCLSCATATSVFLEGEQKRYCQQCGKFHLLPDFDEGKRSCRRKLERHNKRRRRKPDSKNNEKEMDNDEIDLLTNLTGETSNGGGSETVEIETIETVSNNNNVNNNIDNNKCLVKENSIGSDENGNVSPVCTLPSLQNEQSVSVLSAENEGKFDTNDNHNNINNVSNVNNNVNDNGRATDSSLFYENKSGYSSTCPTGRISFKLYDWNPAEFPRRLRHQIFEWLSSMPVELEGYIRPGCTILTLFIAMPQSMWDKLSQDAAALVRELVNTPGSLLFGRGTFLIYLDNMIFQIMKDGTSLMNVRMEVHAPKIHYVHPTFFEVGKPIDFIICGSFLNQPKFRSLVSFNGKYVKHKCNIVGNKITGGTGDDYFSNSDHEMLRISISHTEHDIHGPAFIEVDNVSGLSNFVPVLFGTKHLCTELKKIQEEALNANLNQNNIFSCENFVSKQNLLSELLLDIAWLQKKPNLFHENNNINNNKLSRVNIQRLTHLLRFLVSRNLINILEIVLFSLENLLAGEILSNLERGKHDADVAKFIELINQAKDCLHNKQDIGPLLTNGDEQNPCSTSETYQQEDQETETHSLVHKQVLSLSHRECCGPEFARTWSVRYPGGPTKARFAAIVMVGVLVCMTACIVLFHPHEPGSFAVSVRRYLYRGS